MIFEKVLESTLTKMAPSMQEIISTINITGMERSHILMEFHTVEIGRMVKWMDYVFIQRINLFMFRYMKTIRLFKP